MTNLGIRIRITKNPSRKERIFDKNDELPLRWLHLRRASFDDGPS